uniref:Molybdate-anion transporter n=1 Tax=Odontella aurita TaxID=265563 RepID=A0A7S4IG48_9STRA|mmetsp:Transcript_24734/g.72421  ORF Transcript_24734/g.72421 Transcript_24734/m.72421 type:complete len:591 (+) Transcript_24734:202-1974(+)
MTATARPLGFRRPGAVLLAALLFAAVASDARAFASPRVAHPRSASGAAGGGGTCARPPRGLLASTPLCTNRRGRGGSSELNMSLRPAMDVTLKVVQSVRGGSSAGEAAAASAGVGGALAELASTPSSLFRAALVSVGVVVAALKFGPLAESSSDGATLADGTKEGQNKKPAAVKSLQMRFLAVFWLLRCADWLQGPYFYEVYASKIFNGAPATLAMISRLFLTGFASTALFGPLVGRMSDQYGRRAGTLAFSLLYALGAASTKSPLLWVLLAGRMLSGIGTSLLFSAPESWLVGEALKTDKGGEYLGETFGLAYAGDSIVAILAGQLAMAAAGSRGPTGPFELSVGFLAMGGLLTSLLWGENKAELSGDTDSKPTIREAVDVVKSDPKIALVGAVQSLFEAAMYIFVLQWPPAISKAIASAYGESSSTPYGAVFSCFMACCLLGSTIFGRLTKSGVSTESSTSAMLVSATLAMGAATFASTAGFAGAATASAPLAALVAAFFAFEACVGMYFPSIGTLRSKYVPDSHRSVIMNLFGVPLNVLVVTVFLSIKRLGVDGALSVSTGALALASLSMLKLRSMVSKADTNAAMA